jgi:uncharacterized repeat protein (TIGR03803 family)
MQRKSFSIGLTTVLTQIAAVVVLLAGSQATTRERVLHAFTGLADGGFPQAALVMDTAGNFYGTASEGGASGFGNVFELARTKGGGWTETVLYSFAGGADGSDPAGELIFDAAGNLYGTTAGGGANNDGTVFELSPGATGWTETVLHSFNDSDGAFPRAGLVFDGKGSLYGTTFSGGKPLDLGVVFQLSPTSNGHWKEKVILEFGHRADGGGPDGTLIFDAAGNLYGTASGGYQVEGSVFELTPLANGKWKEKILHGFTGKGDGGFPHGSLVLDSDGNLYGTTRDGGRLTDTGPCSFGCGTVFKLSPGSNGKWKETVIRKFNGGKDGKGPVAGLAFDTAGNLYGTTEMGGGTGCDFQFGCGTAFELIPEKGGEWKERVLHRFQSNEGGKHPLAGLVLDARGNSYGTASNNGRGNAGVVFEITP